MASTGALHAWELERGRKSWRIPVRATVISNDSALRIALATRGLGLAYAATVPGFYLYYPKRARHSPLLRLFVAMAREAVQMTSAA